MQQGKGKPNLILFLNKHRCIDGYDHSLQSIFFKILNEAGSFYNAYFILKTMTTKSDLVKSLVN